MLFFLKQKIVFGFLLSILPLLSFASIFSMEFSENNKIKENLVEQSALAFYETILNKVASEKKISDIVKTQETKRQILGLTESVISESLNLNLKVLVKNQKLFEEFAKGLANKIIGILDLVHICVDGKTSKLSEIIKLDNCDKTNLTIFLILEITQALKPSGLIHLDHKKIKHACKRCGKLTCACCAGSCICITCVGVGYQNPEVMQSFIEDFPKSSLCALGTTLTCCFDQCCFRGYLLKELCSVFKNMLGGIKCWFCCCNDEDDEKDSKV